MKPVHFARRAGAFVRSVMPAEPAHWLLLLDATFLFISRELRWWPDEVRGAAHLYSWALLTRGLTLPILFAGVVAYWLVLLPRRRAELWLWVAVLLPSIMAMLAIAIVGLVWYPDEIGLSKFLPSSVMRSSGDYWSAIPQAPLSLGPGSLYAGLGIVLAFVFTILFLRGRATLPITFHRGATLGLSAPSSDFGRRTEAFVWAMIALMPVANFLESAIYLPFFSAFRGTSRVSPDVTIFVDNAVSAIGLFLLIWVVLRSDLKLVFSEAVKRCPAKYFGFAILFPVLVSSVWAVVLFARERFLWAELDLGQFSGPRLERFFGLPSAIYLTMLFPAFVEEVAWRGYLQPIFVKRYGIMRGIFLVGIVWGAFHFGGDFSIRTAANAVPLILIQRVAETAAQSYAFGWLAIRSGSILPAAVTHGFFNMFLAPRIPIHTPIWILITLWAILGYVLFRYFPPPRSEEPAPEIAPVLTQEPAVPGYNEISG